MKKKTLKIQTNGENFYDITEQLRGLHLNNDGVLHLFLPHTSCALCISEAFDPSAILDVGSFMRHLAPRSLSFITHTTEGPDDSPSHMKSVLLHQSLQLIVENSEILLGQWQGVFIAEFRDAPHIRQLHYKYIED